MFPHETLVAQNHALFATRAAAKVTRPADDASPESNSPTEVGVVLND